MIKIITSPDNVLAYLEDIKALANSQKEELGFIPYAAYEDSPYKGNLFVALLKEQEKESFAGYVLLGGRFPVKRIFQLAVAPQHRRKGVGMTLVDKVVRDAEERGFYDITIKVGKALSANHFWGKARFDLVSTKKGGQLHSLVNIRVREIMPSLFSTGWQTRDSLQLVASRIPSGPTLYLLDTNILLDISNEHREDRRVSQNLFRLVDKGDINVAVAQEALEELKKYHKQEGDPVLTMTNNLPRLDICEDTDLKNRLYEIVFSFKENVSRRDDSDIKHIATAISNNAKGFITRDQSILKKQDALWNEFSLEILSPTDLWEEDEPQEPDGMVLKTIATEENIEILIELTVDSRERIKKISHEHEINENKFIYASLQINGVIIVICAIEKEIPMGGRAREAILFLPDNIDRMAVSTMLDFISSQPVSDERPSAISLSFYGWNNQMTSTLVEHGYHKAENNMYRKIFAGPIIGKQNWQEKKNAIERLSSISFPDALPNYQNFNQEVLLGQERSAPLQALEDFLSTIFLLPKRDGVIVPIKKEYADALFGHSPQVSLFSPPEARLSEYKSYFGTHRVASRLSVGKLLFFYQSKSQSDPGKIIAFARIARSHIASKDKTEQESRRRGVLDDNGFENLTRANTVLETVFAHSVVFPMPVTLKRLREIGCNDRANFVTAFNINHRQVCKILKAGGIL